MDYIPIYNTNLDYYCYSANEKKVYIGMQKGFRPNLFYFLGIYLVPIISEKIDDLLVGSHENFCILLHICSLIGGVILGNLIYFKYMEKINSELKELVLTQKEIEDYIRKGKTQFLLQVLIIVGLFVVSVFFALLEHNRARIIYSFLKFISFFCFTVTVLWIKPYKRIKLLKTLE